METADSHDFSREEDDEPMAAIRTENAIVGPFLRESLANGTGLERRPIATSLPSFAAIRPELTEERMN